MSKPAVYSVLLLILVAIGAIWYVQYQYYRTPVEDEILVDENGEEIIVDERAERETDGLRHSINLDDIQIGNPRMDGIPSIDDPSYETVYAADLYLDDNGDGIVVEVGGLARFYPFQILVWHEIVNDSFAGEDLLVTFCPLCYTGIVYDRTVDNHVLEFGVSGKLWNSNLLMYDRDTVSYWSQALGEAVVGGYTGTKLETYPFLIMTWDAFKDSYPGGQVLSRDTGFERDYTQDPYESDGYYESADVWFTLSHEDGRLHAKELVFGYYDGEEARAYPSDSVEEADVINEDGRLVFWDDEVEAVRAYLNIVDGKKLEFEKTEDFLQDDLTGSLWNYDGEAVSGDYRGIVLAPIVLKSSFWFSWATSYPETTIYEFVTGDGL
jgi:hypothetical protein